MLQSYLKIALRTLGRQKGYAFINITGLAVGITCCVLILFYVVDEVSYDRFHRHADRIYRVTVEGRVPNSPPDRFASSSRPLARAIRASYPEAEHVVRLQPWNPTVKHRGEYYFDDDFLFAEPGVFDVFTFPLVEGDPATALTAPYSVVLTREMEQKYFGDGPALGRTITLDDTLSFTVTGIVADVPHRSHLTFDFLVSYETFLGFQPESEDEWLSLNGYTYLVLAEGAAPEAFAAKISDLIMRNYGERLRGAGIEAVVGLQPLRDIYLHSKLGAEVGPTSDIRYVYAFSAIALFVLLIACINFMNLSTARSMERAKEVGVRKVVGSSRGLLVRQFLAESILVAFFALGLAIALVAAALPLFNSLSGKEMTFFTLLAPGFLAGLLGLALAVGLLAGGYPAFVLSSFRPVEVLKGAFHGTSRGVRLRQGLVVFQFTISVTLIIGTLVAFQQLRFMRQQDVGFAREQILVLDANGLPGNLLQQQYETARREFMRHPAVRSASASNTVPGRIGWLQIVRPEGLPEGDSRRMQILPTDHHFLETYGIPLAAGRDFSTEFETDLQEAVLINETAAEDVGWTPEEALGKRIGFGSREGVVVGVVRDFHQQSLKERIEPLLMPILPSTFNYFSVCVETGDAPAVVAHLAATWRALYPGYSFTYFFLDEDYDRQYRAERQLTRIFGTFTVLAVLIACLGLFGLASFITMRRTKEIGVRKVLGASVPGIVLLLSKDFVRLVLLAVVLAAPLAYFGMDRWLADFPYRIHIGAGVLLLAGLVAVLIAVVTVSYQSVRAALQDPVRSLRYE